MANLYQNQSLKMLLWHMSREPRSRINYLEKKIDKQTVIYDEQAQTKSQRTNNVRDELILGRTRSGDKVYIIAPIECLASRDIFN